VITKITLEACREEAGLVRSPTSWDDSYTKSVKTLHCEFVFSRPQVQMLVESCRACLLEFSSRWAEFCSAMPGSIGMLDIQPAALRAMETFFEDLLNAADRPDDDGQEPGC
jgi:hypothetical protein